MRIMPRAVHCFARVVGVFAWLAILLAAAGSLAEEGGKKRIVFIAGRASHNYGAHEHYAGSMILANALQERVREVQTEVIRDGWPEDDSVLDGAAAIVMYSDGGGGHPAIPHLARLDELAKRGVGVVCIHYAVEVPKGEAGEKFLDWIGGYFEPHWSVNPHWSGKFDNLPDHPITRGVKPFEIHDEWYYHMRFREGMEGVTPILTDLPPKDTLSRPDGPHSGNPHVRQAIANGEEQHVAWAYERPGGGRGFGFTGGHNHWNWGDDNFRKLVLNAILWTAHVEVPEGGVSDRRLTIADLEKNQDEPQPENFNRQDIINRLKLPAEGGAAEEKPGAAKGAANKRRPGAEKPIFASPIVTAQTPGHAVEVKADITGAKELHLVATDGGDGFGCDWVDWAEPRIIGPAGEKKLTELPWKSAATDWGEVRLNRNAGGGELKIAGQSVAYGIGAHANSVISFALPEGYTRFEARAGLDNGGTDQGCGSSVQFFVFTKSPSAFLAQSSQGASVSRDPMDAVAGLDVAEGLEATLFASEPELLSLTNLDIDHRGRIWVCEVVNYRKHNGRREDGDRLLILEDVDGDGAADSTKVYYQGRDIDSAMGVCVLGNKVIVSASPHVLVFTDENGDDKPDRKEVLFSNTGQPQHDHSAHSFVFGPDGKLYWNFGNTGQKVCDKDGKTIVDLAGNEVIDDGQPYFGGMPFRCNLDGSEFEVLAHNFRNNYEVAVDSFGTLWQSDNDDDGNQGVRINYVMEFGNYGYREEFTGAGWNTPRTNAEAEIPLRHWHLNDPGVVPNLLQTGAGSPTGIMVYEGSLLPEVFRNQVIHCDAGPNIVRAYPVQKQGAGYSATIVNLLHGARDNWFRPADVCVAPDGSLFVTDWYDPGVGGHNMVDLERGRLFRIAPPGSKYQTPKFDFETIDGAASALQNPNLAVRYLAWTRLHSAGAEAEPALARLFNDSSDDRMRARALWLLGKIEGRGKHYVELAIADRSPDIRIVGIRLARQLKLPPAPIASRLADDSDPQVRRECAIALRGQKSPAAAEAWAKLARAHDGRDRWYLEALGIGAEGAWDACLAAWKKLAPKQQTTLAGRDILWRSRGAETPLLLARLALDPQTPVEEMPRLMRAFDFLPGNPNVEPALIELAFSSQADSARRDFLASEALGRLKGFDISSNPAHAKALSQALERLQGGPTFVSLVGKFSVADRYPQLLAIARENADQQLGIEAARVLLEKGQTALLQQSLDSEDPVVATQTAVALGNAADGRAIAILAPIAKDAKRPLELRRQAARGLARTKKGAETLLQWAADDAAAKEIASAAAFQLNAAPWAEIKSQAALLFPLPAVKNEPLPPIAELVQRTGDAARGKKLFTTTAECSKCHVVNQEGKEVGPNLSEIGGKLSRQSLIESILYPSAGISHNYETYALALEDGNVATGIKVSETPDEIVLKSSEAILQTFKKSQIEDIKKQPISLMPADLQKTMTTSDLIDVVEYLTTLKKG